MTVRLIVRVTNYAENAPLTSFRTIEVESPKLEQLLAMDYGNRAHAEVIGAEPLPAGIQGDGKRESGEGASKDGGEVGVQPIGWLYDWAHSSALGKPDEHFTGFTKDEAYARKHGNPRRVYAAPTASQKVRPCGEGECRAAERDSIICEGECDVAAGRRPDGVSLLGEVQCDTPRNIDWRCNTSGRGYVLLLNDKPLTGGEAVALARGVMVRGEALPVVGSSGSDWEAVGGFRFDRHAGWQQVAAEYANNSDVTTLYRKRAAGVPGCAADEPSAILARIAALDAERAALWSKYAKHEEAEEDWRAAGVAVLDDSQPYIDAMDRALMERAKTLYSLSPRAYRGTRPLPWDEAPAPTQQEFIDKAKAESAGVTVLDSQKATPDEPSN